MAHAFTPGLKVTERAVVRKARRLPLLGEVLVAKGQHVKASDVVARTELPGKVFPANVANSLGILPEELPDVMKKKVGDNVERGEVIAETPGLFGKYFKARFESPITGFIENISKVTGQVMLQEHPTPVEVQAYIDGVVTEVYEREGVEVTSPATFIQGIFGLGGERHGEVKVVCAKPTDVLEPDCIDESCRGKVLLGGAFATLDAVHRAFDVGAAALVTGGFDYSDIKALLGYEVGVAITGGEKIPTTLIVTEGFGRIDMARRTHALLARHEGERASVNGATQIRAGVIRPEVIIPKPEDVSTEELGQPPEVKGLEVGDVIRCIRYPHFGRIGKVVALPPELRKMESETEVRVLEVEFEDGERAIVPRANIEMIEDA
ncbi:MAG: hypothetical protein D6729_06315 [Deltaproteobacteria bacterium]|nr:MAG: hypothetical protein D6729_06315 [Deltaproteobacteria bacterium]